MTPDELERELTEHHADAFGWALSCCDGDEQEAADVLQSTYVKVLSGQASFGGRSAFRTWLFGVVRLTAVERRRRRNSQSERARRLALQSSGAVSDDAPDARVMERERAERIRALLTRLPQRQRQVLHLAFYQGLSLSEAAQVMEISLGSVRTHYHRGKERMRQFLDGSHP